MAAAQRAHVVPLEVALRAVAAALGDEQVGALGEAQQRLAVRSVARVGDDPTRMPHAEPERVDVRRVVHCHALHLHARPLERRAAGLLEPHDARVVSLRESRRGADDLAQSVVDAGRPGDGERVCARDALALRAPRIPVTLRTTLLEQEQVDAADVVGVLVRQQHEVDRRRRHVEAEEVGERLRRAVEQHAPVEQEAAPVGAIGEREAGAEAVETQFRLPVAAGLSRGRRARPRVVL